MANLEKSYSPKAVEDKNYRFWTEKGYFEGQIKPDAPAYSIVMPPPNITGQLHMGHALDNTFQDIFICHIISRSKRNFDICFERNSSRFMNQNWKNSWIA